MELYGIIHRIGGGSTVLLKIITILWLLFMLVLSHIPGEPSGAESRWLSSMTGVREGILRRSAHVVLYLVLAVLATVAWPEAKLWVKGLVLVIIAIGDESSKALSIFHGRHCSIFEIGLNLLGVCIDTMIGLLIS